jgi:predicted aconitase
MENEDFAELFKYCSPYSILVVTWYGKLKALNCPFAVKVIENVGLLGIGDYCRVEKVMLSSSGKTVFVIKGKAYHYHYFDIMTHL